MIQQQNFGTSLFATPAHILRETGALGMFRGLYMACGREGLFAAGMLGISPSIKRYAIDAHGYDTETAKVIAAVTSGVIVANISHPLDTIKTCQQGDIMRKQYGSVVHTARTLFAEGGIGRFYGGWRWRTGRTCFEAYIFDSVKTMLSPILYPHHFK